jgi:predicted transcriptional regulator
MPPTRTTSLYDRVRLAAGKPSSSALSKRKKETTIRTDAILAIDDKYMAQIVSGEKTFEFRTFRFNEQVKRIWFYTTAPVSAIKHVCEIGTLRTRGKGHEPLPEGPQGNKEFNEYHKDWDRHDFAYQILAVYELEKPISLQMMKTVYGMKAAPQSLVYVPEGMRTGIALDQQKKVL